MARNLIWLTSLSWANGEHDFLSPYIVKLPIVLLWGLEMQEGVND